jgi:uncharacterized protein YjbI with pentapeptide repeats
LDPVRTDLTGAHFESADLRDAELLDVPLTDTDFAGTDLNGVLYEPAPQSLPWLRWPRRVAHTWASVAARTLLHAVEMDL